MFAKYRNRTDKLIKIVGCFVLSSTGVVNGYLADYDALNFAVNETSRFYNVAMIVKVYNQSEKIDLCHHGKAYINLFFTFLSFIYNNIKYNYIITCPYIYVSKCKL